MQTQIQCPQCQTPIVADIYQIIDVDQYPQLKQMLLAGALNVAQCRNCGWASQVASPLVYHDSEHQLLMTFVPMEMNIPYAEQERMMGQLVKHVVDNVPQERFRSYLLQPQQMMRWQTFIEKVLETEGITKEMIELQRKQSELLQTLMTADQDVVDYLFTDRMREIDDDTFVAMVQSALQQAIQAQQDKALIALSNLQARIMRDTKAGQRAERRQLAQHRFSQAAKAADGVSAELLAEHIILNADDDQTVDALVNASGILSYEVFSAITSAADEATAAGDVAQANLLTQQRTRLLAMYDEMQKRSERLLQEAIVTLNTIAAAPDKNAALMENASKIDEAFMMVLEQELQRARQEADLARSASLNAVKTEIEQLVRQSSPPHMQLINALVRAPSAEHANQLLDANAQLVTPELVEMIGAMTNEMPADTPPELVTRVKQIQALVAQRVATA